MFIHTHLHFQKHTIKRCLIPLACQLVSPVHIYAARRSSTTNYTYIKRERERDGRWSWKFLFGSAQCHKRPFDVGFPSNDNATAAAYYSRTASYTDKKKTNVVDMNAVWEASGNYKRHRYTYRIFRADLFVIIIVNENRWTFAFRPFGNYRCKQPESRIRKQNEHNNRNSKKI